MTRAVVVGSGPNGLAGAVRLAQAGVRVHVVEANDTLGGGARSSDTLTLPGLLHDECSAVHPTGVASPFFRALPLEEHGLRWRWPEIDLAHPLDDGSAAVLRRDLDATADGLGRDGAAWARLFAPLAARFDDLADDVLRPVASLPRHPATLARFAAAALPPASWTARRWSTPAARALFGGVAAHALGSLSAPLSSAVGVLLGAAGHARGWPVAEGGSRAVTDALLGVLRGLGGTVETGVRVDALEQLGGPDVVLLDVSPRAALRILGDRLPRRAARAFRRYAYGPAAYKVDLAVRGGVPWRADACRRAGTVHLGGTFEELAGAEAAVVRGVLPRRPFVLVAQQSLADPGRAVGDVHPVWTYAHVPHGHRGDVTQAVLAQLERFAPGVRERVVGLAVRDVAGLERHDENYVGGDIAVGAATPRQLVLRPRAALDPYATGVPGVFLCSSATPPGAGVHGMCGYGAATSALRGLGLAA